MLMMVGCGSNARAAYVKASVEFGCSMFDPGQFVNSDKDLENRMKRIYEKHGFLIKTNEDLKAMEAQFGKLPGVENEIKGGLENCYSGFDLSKIIE